MRAAAALIRTVEVCGALAENISHYSRSMLMEKVYSSIEI
jgi:hypothetical protein